MTDRLEIASRLLAGWLASEEGIRHSVAFGDIKTILGIISKSVMLADALLDYDAKYPRKNETPAATD